MGLLVPVERRLQERNRMAEYVPLYIEPDRETDRFSKDKRKMKIRCDGCGKTVKF